MNKKLFMQILGWAMEQPGSIEVGTTADTQDKYIAWYPNADQRPLFWFCFWSETSNACSPMHGKEMQIEFRDIQEWEPNEPRPAA